MLSTHSVRARRRPAVFAATLAAATAATVAVAAPPATAGPTADPVAGTPATPSGAVEAVPLTLDGLGAGPHTVTLVTGDRVTLTGAGRGYTIDIDAAERPAGLPEPDFRGDGGPDGLFVIPEDVRPAVEAGLLDRGLFDVEYLLENGYGDADTASLPVIVQYPRGLRAASPTAAAQALPASTATVDLPSIGAAGLTVPKGQAAAFFRAVLPGTAGAAAGTLSAGIGRMWLDRKVTASLDASVPLVGAPQAWQAGLDGTGVQVAVLDTGIDETHPDLAGRVAVSRSFVPGEEVADGNGHGTHVASTIAGSGAASDGRFRGVAPGAQLVVGKVLNNAGSGLTSWIVDGMEWAVTSGASVVSMSLGGGPTDGTDPLSTAVDTLTAQTGTLFVIAAGNRGDVESIDAPGAASSALTVAATDKADGLADFSSRGPRLDGALKPDIVAPGLNITAARAEGTALGPVVDEHYITISGTSMATPHVSGAAAILAQAHPDWDAGRLKAALMSTSTDAGHAVYEQGAGRLDVARAATQQVFALTPNVDFGVRDADAAPDERALTYTNTTGQPVTLTLTATLHGPGGEPVDGVLDSDAAVTVPAGGTATTTVSVDTAGLPDGRYSGTVLAAANGIALRTPVGLLREPPKVILTINSLDHNGQPVTGGAVTVLDVSGDRGTVGPVSIVNGVGTIRVVPGVYDLSQGLHWYDDEPRLNHAWLLAPEVVVTGDTEVTLDARQAQEYTFDTDRPAEPAQHNGADHATMVQRTVVNGQTWFSFASGTSTIRRGVTPTPKITHGAFQAIYGRSLTRPEVTLRTSGRRGTTLHPVLYPHSTTRFQGRVPFEFVPFRTGPLPLVDVGIGTPEDLAGRDVRGKLVLLDLGSGCSIRLSRFQAIRAAGAAAILAWHSNPTNGCFPTAFAPYDVRQDVAGLEPVLGIPYASLPAAEASTLRDRLAAGPVTVDVTGNPPESPYVYEAVVLFQDQVPGTVRQQLTNRNTARIDNEYHSTQPRTFEEAAVPYTMNTPATFRLQHQEVVGAGHRTVYKGPLYRDLITSRHILNTDGMGGWTRIETYPRPVRTHQVLGAAPRTFGAIQTSDEVNALPDPEKGPFEEPEIGLCESCRTGDVLFPSYAVAFGPRHFSVGSIPAPGSMHLFQGDRELTAQRVRGVPPLGYVLPKERARYRLTLDDAHTGNAAEWTFWSQSPTRNTTAPGYICFGHLADRSAPCRSEPLVFVNYDLGSGLRLDNTVDPARGDTFEVIAYHQPSREAQPRIAGLKLWTSTDGGQHWTPARVRPNGADGEYRVIADFPRTSTASVSLKAEAWDVDGNRVVQTTTDAFTLRPDRTHGPRANL